MKKRIVLWMMLTAMLSSVLLSGCQLIPVEEELPVAPVVQSYNAVEYDQVAVKRGDLVSTATIYCRYQALEKEDLSFRLGGEYIESVYVQVGQEVQAGDLLAELVHDSLADQIKSQEYQLDSLNMQKRHLQELKTLELARQDALIAELDAQLQEVNELLTQRTEWEALWKNYEEQLKQWEQDMELWESQQNTPTAPEETIPETTAPEETVPEETIPEETGPETTVPEETVPEETVPEETVPEETVPEEAVPAPQKPQKPQEPEECPVEQTLEELTQQKENLERSRRDQVNMKTSVSNSYDQQIDTVEDSLYVQGLRMDELEVELEERRIYAGIDGIISFIESIRVEQFTSSGIVITDQVGGSQRSVKGETFATVMNTDSMFFTINGEHAARFPVGTETVIVCDRREMKAISVEAPDGAETEETAYLQLITPDPTLEDGASGTIELIAEKRENVLYLPNSAIQTADGTEFVYVLDEEGLKVMQEVTTGVSINGNVEILEGLSEGDSVVVE